MARQPHDIALLSFKKDYASATAERTTAMLSASKVYQFVN